MKVLIIDDHPMFRSSIVSLLSAYFSQAQCFESATAEDALSHLKHNETDLILLDLSLPGIDGTEAVSTIRSLWSDIPILILSASENMHDIQRCLALGANGFVNKTEESETMLAAIQTILNGQRYIPKDLQGQAPLIAQELKQVDGITARQMQVLRLIHEGKRNHEIAKALNVTDATVKVHCRDLYQQLGVNSRLSAVQKSLRLGLLK